VDSSLTDLFCYLVSGRGNNFYARILAALETHQVVNHPRISAMAVCVRDRHYVLIYDPTWLAEATYDEVVAVIEHECMHIVLEHLPRMLDLKAQVANVEQAERLKIVLPFAVDCAVNSLLIDSIQFVKEHASEWVVPGYGHFVGLGKKKSMEWYVKELLKKVKINKIDITALAGILDQSGFNNPGDGHSMYCDSGDSGKSGEEDEDEEGDEDGKGGQGGKSSDEEKEEEEDAGGGSSDEEDTEEDGDDGDGDEPEEEPPELGTGFKLLANHASDEDEEENASPEDMSSLADELRYQTKAVVQKAVDDHQKSRGTVPSQIAEIIKKLLKKPQIPWTQILRDRVVSTKRYSWRRSCARPRRRHLGIPELVPFPGKKKNREFTVAFMEDTSGSMGARELEMAHNELLALQKSDPNIKIHVIHCDAAVEYEYVLGTNDEIEHNAHGRGGTSFDPALIRAKELEPDIAFYFTDGYAPAPAKENRLSCPFCWVITPNGTVPDEDYGYVINTKPYEN